MGSNITYIKPAKFAEIVEQPYLKIDWRGYNLGAGYGNVFGRRKRNKRSLYGSGIRSH